MRGRKGEWGLPTDYFRLKICTPCLLSSPIKSGNIDATKLKPALSVAETNLLHQFVSCDLLH